MGKRLGQHFLHSQSVLAAILDAARPGPGKAVLEIGPGEGILTERLLAAGVSLCAIELDAALAETLRARFGGQPSFRLVEGDVLKLDLSPTALFEGGRRYDVVANLPYYLSTPLLFRLAGNREWVSQLVLMLQLEVGRRIVATPSEGKAYGSLSVAMQHAFEVGWVCRVPASAFRPPPKVESAVLAFTPRPAQLSPGEEAGFFEHVKGLFTRRRKRMLSVLKRGAAHLAPAAWDEVKRLVGERRAENLSPAEHLAVYRALHAGGAPPP